jgi:hypothetical protein
MGRPLNKKYFANTNYQDFGTAGVGGESVASVPNATGLSGMTAGGPYTIAASDISAPDIPGGEKPVLTFTATGATAGTVAVVSAGSGYTSAPTVVVRGALAGGSGTTTKTAVLTTGASARQNGITAYAYIPTADGGSSRVVADIVKQTNDRRYKVKTAQGTGICQLRTDGGNGAGTMDITAYDSAGGEYWVWKLTARKVVVVQKGVGGGSQFATGSSVPWTFGSATLNYSVQIANA